MYKDVTKQREANRKAQARRRGMTEGMTGVMDVTPKDVIPDSHLARSWKSVAEAQAEGKLEAIVRGVVAKEHGGLVRWGCSGPLFQEIAEVWYAPKALPDDADVMGPMAEEFLPEELARFEKVRGRKNTLVIARLPQAQRDELYRGLQASYSRRGE